MFEEKKCCGNCKHWEYYSESQGECPAHNECIEIWGNNITVLTFDNCYCDEFEQSEACIEAARAAYEENLEYYKPGGEAKYNGVKPGVDFPATL